MIECHKPILDGSVKIAYHDFTPWVLDVDSEDTYPLDTEKRHCLKCGKREVRPLTIQSPAEEIFLKSASDVTSSEAGCASGAAKGQVD